MRRPPASWFRSPRSRIAGRRRSFPTGFTVSIRCGSERASDQVPVTRTSPFSHEGEGLRQAGAICLCSRRAILENRSQPASWKRIELESHVLLHRRKPAHNRSGPSQFSRTRPFCRPTIILSGSPLSSVVSGRRRSAGKGSFGGQSFNRLWPCLSGSVEKFPWRGGRLFTDEHWASLLAPPTEEREIVRHCTLSRHDLDLIARQAQRSQPLGFAVLLCYLRHPGRALEAAEEPPAELLASVSRQLESRCRRI